MKKKIFAILLTLTLAAFSLYGCGQPKQIQDQPQSDSAVQSQVARSQSDKFTAGTYEATEKGFGGDILAKVTVTTDEITVIEITANDETPGIGESAANQIGESVVATQSLLVDAITGATVSSNATIAAITAALEKAGADIAELKDASKKIEPTKTAREDFDVDVVVIGAGGAGMTAAIEIKEAGKSVVILERMPMIGGNTTRATGGMNAAETEIQKQNNIEDSKDIFYEDTMKGGKNINDPDLLRTLVDNAPDAIVWLNSLGAEISRVGLSGGQTNPRIHTVADGSAIGPVIVRVLSEKLKAENVEIILNTTATKLIAKDGAVVGVEAEDNDGNTFTVNAKAVVLATGGFGANSTMVESYREDLKGFYTTNHSGATGSGIVMAQEVGADLTDIKEIQIHPTADPKTGYMFTEGLRGDGAILVNKNGERFTNELLTRDVVSRNILDQSDGTAYLIVDEALRNTNGALAGYVKDGYAIEGATIADLAKAINMDAAVLENTLSKYNKAVEQGKDEEFGRENLSVKLETGPFYALSVKPSIHHTMGGVKIDTKTHVINTSGDIIKGLYAAGEVTGGVHGGNRIGGNAVADIIVFGRIAGQTAAAELK